MAASKKAIKREAKKQKRLGKKLAKRESFNISENKIPSIESPPKFHKKPTHEDFTFEHFRTVKSREKPATTNYKKMVYSMEISDREGEWEWGRSRDWGIKNWNKYINPALIQFSCKTWGEIQSEMTGNRKNRHKKHHDMDVDILRKEAQKRLYDLEYDDFDKIFRFRISGRKRLWGFRICECFFFLWYDPKHEIYPSGK